MNIVHKAATYTLRVSVTYLTTSVCRMENSALHSYCCALNTLSPDSGVEYDALNGFFSGILTILYPLAISQWVARNILS